MTVQFDPLRDLKSEDLAPRYRELRDQAPVHWSAKDELFVVSRYEDVLAVVKDAETFSSDAMRVILTAGMMVPLTPRYAMKLLAFAFQARINPFAVLRAGNLISLDGERHSVLRKIVGRGFTPSRIAEWQPRVHSIVEGLVAKLRKRDRIDVMGDLAIPLPTTIIAEMLGVEPERREDFKRWSASIIDVASGGAKDNFLDSGVFEDLKSLYLYLGNVIGQRRRDPRDDLISVLVDPRQGGVLGEIDIIQFVVLLLVAGNETTSNLIGNAVSALLDHPSQLDRVVEDPSLVANVITETLRFEPPLSVAFRNTTQDVELRGVRIAKGKTLALLMGSANRDERRFENPDRFDIDRDASGHLAFGFGVHFCLGQALARLQAEVALSALIPELPAFRRSGPPSELIDSFLVRGRKSVDLQRA